MSTELYFSVSNNDQASPGPLLSLPERTSAVGCPLDRHQSPHHDFGSGAINMYHQQQIQAALYQQQQLEFAQQQAQLEMHLQLEQMRLQNLALQEQIMLGQAQHAHQQAQAQAEQHLRNSLYASTKPVAVNRPNFTHSQGGLLAERAMARRQQAEADALYAQYYPPLDNLELSEAETGKSLASAMRNSGSSESHSPPALVVSRPDEAFPVFAPAPSTTVKISTPCAAVKPTNQEDCSPHEARRSGSPVRLPAAARADFAVAPRKKFSEVVKSSPAAANKTLPPVSTSSEATVPKLNPCSSVFVPGHATSAESVSGNHQLSSAHNGRCTKVVDKAGDAEATPTAATSTSMSDFIPTPKTPPSGKPSCARNVSGPNASQAAAGGVPTRQPRGPAAEAELTNQNFATRIRKRAIGAIRTLGSRTPNSPGVLTSSSNSSNYQYLQQQQFLEALMVQQQQQRALAAAGYLEVGPGYHHRVPSAGGIAHLMATARAREERFGY